IADVTGAGDALAGTTVAALMRGQALRQAVREGIAASMLALASADAAPGFTPAAFAGALALVPEPVEVA
ncbi:MAG: carbohydrate kinase, partial [Mesorhizobium sp.]